MALQISAIVLHKLVPLAKHNSQYYFIITAFVKKYHFSLQAIRTFVPCHGRADRAFARALAVTSNPCLACLTFALAESPY